MLVLDHRHISRPSFLDGTHEGWYDEWKFQLVAWLSADPRFADVADEVTRKTVPYVQADLLPDEEGKKAHLASANSMLSSESLAEARIY